MNTDELQKSLSESELEEIHAVLDDETAGLVPWALDGFLTAVGSAPSGLMPGDWLPWILGDFDFEAEGGYSRFVGLVLRRFNEVLRRTACSEPAWPPTSMEYEEIIDWCDGYMQVARGDSKWLRDEWAHNQLFSISVLAGEFDLVGQEDADGEIIEDAAPFIVAYCRLLPDTVRKLDDYWKELRRMDLQRPSPILSDKTGRNEPCPCASGRKYKKCCGRAG